MPEAEIVNPVEDEALPILTSGNFLGGHTMPWGSNYTFLIWLSVGDGSQCIRAIYKPRNGERPLTDFPHGTLFKREYASYLLSTDLGWPNVPLTTVREGPYGIGSVQLYVDCDPRITYFEMRDTFAEELIEVAVFDLLSNNADRKAGHCMIDSNGSIWSIDHGLTFHKVFKLRTVMLEYCGKQIPSNLVSDLKSLANRLESSSEIKTTLTEQTSTGEVDALIRRLTAMVDNPIIPLLDPYRNVPWPFV